MARLGICVLGGCGAMGRVIVECLRRKDSTVPVSVADCRVPGGNDFPKGVQFYQVDLLKPRSLVRLLREHRVVINSTSHHFNLPVMKAALEADVHYLDLGGLFHFTRRQLKWDRMFRERRRIAILGMGCAPGISNLLAVWGSQKFDSIREVHIKVGGRSWSSNAEAIPYAVGTIREELTWKPAVYHGGRWYHKPPRSGVEVYRFPPPVGRQRIFYTIHSEVATLPRSLKGVRESSFKIGFSDEVIEKVLKRSRKTQHGVCRPLSKTKESKPSDLRDCEITLALLKGTSRGRRVSLLAGCRVWSREGHSAGDWDTAWPPALVALMIYSGEIQGAGVFPPEKMVPAQPLLTQLSKQGFEFFRRKIS